MTLAELLAAWERASRRKVKTRKRFDRSNYTPTKKERPHQRRPRKPAPRGREELVARQKKERPCR